MAEFCAISTMGPGARAGATRKAVSHRKSAGCRIFLKLKINPLFPSFSCMLLPIYLVLIGLHLSLKR